MPYRFWLIFLKNVCSDDRQRKTMNKETRGYMFLTVFSHPQLAFFNFELNQKNG